MSSLGMQRESTNIYKDQTHTKNHSYENSNTAKMVESKILRMPPAHRARAYAIRRKSITRKMLATCVAVFFLVSPIFVSGSSKGILSDSSMVYSISAPRRSEVVSLVQVVRISRGGATNRRGKGGLYLKALDDEILWLQQQLRRMEQEKRSLNKNLSKRRRARESAMKSKNKNKQKEGEAKKISIEEHEEDLLRLANLEQLEKQKESLLAAKAQLESIKLDYEQKLLALESDLSKSKSRNDNLEKTFLARVKQLEASLKKVREAAANPQMNNDPELSRKINEACQVAIAEFWVEGNRKLQEHEQQLKQKYEEEIAEERRLSALAVEKQRQKMRALARATAIREKELFARKKLESRQKTQNALSSVNKNSHQEKEEASEREKIKRLRQEAERKAKEEEKRMWLELERELKEERERLQRMKQREEEEKRRCEQEELERRRLLQQHALDLEDRLRKEQQEAASGERGRSGPSLFGRFFSFRKKVDYLPEPTIQAVSIENYQRRVMWQPITLPPKEAIQITGPHNTD